MTDLDGDQIPEIIFADGNDLENSVFRNASCLASLNAVNSKSGEPVWDAESVAKIRCHDRQIQNVLMGPDFNGDQLKDVYAVSSMSDHISNFIYVDVFSGTTGERIAVLDYKIPASLQKPDISLDFETPFFLGPAGDVRSARLVVATKSCFRQSNRQSTFVLSIASGDFSHIANQLEFPILADGDGDGWKDLFLVKPRSRRKLFDSAQLVSMNGLGGRGFSSNRGGIEVVDDIDGDGVRDLLSSNDSQVGPLSIHSGFTGRKIESIESAEIWSEFSLIDGDIDGDGIKDYVGVEMDFVSVPNSATISAISSESGERLWSQDVVVDSTGPGVVCFVRDLDRDGESELLMVYRMGNGSFAQNRAFICCRKASNGAELWNCEIAAVSSLGQVNNVDFSDYEFELIDINNDGTDDVICPAYDANDHATSMAIDGATGKSVWKLPYHLSRFPNSLPIWHAGIIRNGEISDSFFLQARAIEGRGVGPQLELESYRLSDGKLLSKWTTKGRMVQHRSPRGEQLPFIGVPFQVNFNGEVLAGFCFNDDSGEMNVAVFELNNGQLKEVRKSQTQHFFSNPLQYARNMFVAVTDSNNDGDSDIILSSGRDLVSFDLMSGKVLASCQLSNVVSMKLEQSGTESKLLVETNVDGHAKLKQLDVATLKTELDIHLPHNKQLRKILTIADGDRRIPEEMTLLMDGDVDSPAVMVRTAISGEANTSDLVDTRDFSARPSDYRQDARLVEPLPWNTKHDQRSLRQRFWAIVTQEIPVALGAIVFPVLFLRRLWLRRKWNLQWMLAFPLVFVCPYIALRIPFEFGEAFAQQSSLAVWQGKYIAAMLAIPTFVFCWKFGEKIWQREWRSALWLGIWVLALSSVAGAIQLYGGPTTNTGGVYDWTDPGSVALLLTGAWIIGFLMIVKWGVLRIAFLSGCMWRFVNRTEKLSVS